MNTDTKQIEEEQLKTLIDIFNCAYLARETAGLSSDDYENLLRSFKKELSDYITKTKEETNLKEAGFVSIKNAVEISKIQEETVGGFVEWLKTASMKGHSADVVRVYMVILEGLKGDMEVYLNQLKDKI